MNLEDLKTTLQEIQFTVSVRNTGKNAVHIASGGMFYLENLLIAMSCNCKGLAETLTKSEDFVDLIKEFVLENMHLIYTKPQYCILFTVATTALNLHVVNSAIDTIQTQQNKDFIDVMNKMKNNQLNDKQASINKEFDSL